MPVFTSGDSARPGFSIAMELLICLPRHPRRVPLAQVAEDIGLKNQTAAFDIIHGLRAIGFDVYVTNDDGRRVCIGPESWAAAQFAGNNYWETVWGTLRHTAQDLGGPPKAPSSAA